MRHVFDCDYFVESGFSHGSNLEIPGGGRMHVRAEFLGRGCTLQKGRRHALVRAEFDRALRVIHWSSKPYSSNDVVTFKKARLRLVNAWRELMEATFIIH
jgi:hypothetical protein